MKKILMIGTIFTLSITLFACQNENTEDIDLTTLDYYSYLSDDNPKMVIKVKDYGVMKIQLFKDVAPITVDNIIDYISNGDYTNTTFHRVIKDFMIQGGAVKNNNSPIIGEFISNGINNDLLHTRGVISMARTNIKNSATSQFFIVHKNSPWLDGEYAGFGGLVSGFNVLDKIASVNTNQMDAPLKSVIIESIKIENN